MTTRRQFVAGVAGVMAEQVASAKMHTAAARTVTHGSEVVISSPHFVFRLDTSNGLRAISWKNKLTGRLLTMGMGSEVEYDIGVPGKPTVTPRLTVIRKPLQGSVAANQVEFDLSSDTCSGNVTVRYSWDGQSPTLHKFVTIRNAGTREWDRLLNVRLGTYHLNAREETPDPDYPIRVTATPWGSTTWSEVPDPAGRVRGFPGYLEWQYFVGLAHPSGCVFRNAQELGLHQYPGIKLSPGAQFICMEAVYGVSPSGQARPAFQEYIRSRMRRIRRKHNKPYAILGSLGGNPSGDFWETASYLEDNLDKVTTGQRESNLHWDYYQIDFWHDPYGDLKTADAKRFPHGLARTLVKLKDVGTSPGLWIDSGGYVGKEGFAVWTCGGNPALKDSTTLGNGRGALCRATAPAKQFYIDGFRHQCVTNGVRMAIFDNCGYPETHLDPSCDNPEHDHLPGNYSTEAIQDAIVNFFVELDKACPEVFIRLFWGYRSPWWLLHADTLFDTGTRTEAASFADSPTLIARDSVTRSLDCARWTAKDLPWLGTDSLGVWLADWPWNMHQREEDWEKGVIMDICRGHLLPQLWTDPTLLSPPGRLQMAEFIALVKAQPRCFSNSRFILGNPWKDKVYGYCCSDNTRAFLAINNSDWKERSITLELNEAWGLGTKHRWEVYRWYPRPAKLLQTQAKPMLQLGPFEVVLLEIVPAGMAPALEWTWSNQPLSAPAAETALHLPLNVSQSLVQDQHQMFVTGSIPALSSDGWLAITAKFSKGGQPFLTLWSATVIIASGSLASETIELTPVIDPRGGLYPSCWQAWRLKVPPHEKARSLNVAFSSSLPADVQFTWDAYVLSSA